MADFVSAVNDFFLKEKGICVNDVAFMEMPNEKEKYNLSKVIGNVNLCADRFKIKSEANAVIDKFLSMSLPWHSIGQFSLATVTHFFPEYYTEIKPKISEIQQIVAQLRMGSAIDCDETFFNYFELITKLREINTCIDKRIPALQEYADNKAKEKKRERLWQFGIGVISAAAGALLTWFITK